MLDRVADACTNIPPAYVALGLAGYDGQGRVPVNEILIGSSALSAIIREGAVHKIVTYIEGNRGEGMQLMDDSIMSRLKDGLCTPNEAYMKALDKSRFEHLKGKGKKSED